MKKKQTLVVALIALGQFAMAQKPYATDSIESAVDEEAQFTFTEAQLGEDDDMSQSVTILNSNSNTYASSGLRFLSRTLPLPRLQPEVQ